MSFYKKMFLSSIIPDMIVLAVSILFCIYIMQSFSVPVIKLFATVFIIEIALKFLLSPLIDYFLYGSVSKDYSKFLSLGMTETQRTELLEKMFQKPLVAAIKVILYFAPCALWMFFALEYLGETEFHYNIIVLVYLLVGALYASILSFDAANRVCVEFATAIVAKGVDKKYVQQRKFFGPSMLFQMIIYIIVPIFITVIVTVLVLAVGYYPFDDHTVWASFGVQCTRMGFVLVLNIFLVGVPLIMFFMKLRKTNDKLSKIFDAIGDNTIVTKNLLDVDLKDEMSYSYYMMKELILYLRKIILSSAQIGDEISNLAKSLLKLADDMGSDSLSQSSGVNKILDTVAASTQGVVQIESDIVQMRGLSDDSVENVRQGFTVLQQNIDMISEMLRCNDNTIFEIKELTEKVDNVWEIINIINSIVDQTKIIAFNAELEAANIPAGTAKNFSNISSEIRRLAKNTIDSIFEIKKRIGEMQNTANVLLRSTMDNGVAIQQGYESTKSLEQRFSHIRGQYQSSTSYANEIMERAKQQVDEFNQIGLMITHMIESLNKFTDLTQTIAATSSLLETNSMWLNQIGQRDEYQKNFKDTMIN